MTTGTVTMWNTDKGFGTITLDGGGGTVYGLYSDINAKGFRALSVGQKVSFDVVDGTRGKTSRQHQSHLNLSTPNAVTI